MRDRVKVKLTHYCGAEVARGVPGDILEVTPSVARWLLDRGGAVCVDAPAPGQGPTEPAKSPVAPEAATAGPAENAATRTGPPPARRPGGAATKK